MIEQRMNQCCFPMNLGLLYCNQTAVFVFITNQMKDLLTVVFKNMTDLVAEMGGCRRPNLDFVDGTLNAV